MDENVFYPMNLAQLGMLLSLITQINQKWSFDQYGWVE